MNAKNGALPPFPPPFPPPAPTGEIASPWFTDRGREIRDRVRELAPLIRANAQEGEKIRALTPEVLAALDDAGIYRMTGTHSALETSSRLSVRSERPMGPQAGRASSVWG
jgi:hypothetical protein